MKTKLAAYTAAAVLIGFTFMMLPLALETGPPTYDPREAPSRYLSPLSGGENEQTNQRDGTYAPSLPSSNVLPAGLIPLVGLAVALVAYASLRKQLK